MSEVEVIYSRYDTSPIGLKKNWVTDAGGLPPFVRAVAHALIRNGHSESDAIQMAIGVIKRWATGSIKWGKAHHVTPETQAKAAATVAEWEALKAKSHSRSWEEWDEARGSHTFDPEHHEVVPVTQLHPGDRIAAWEPARARGVRPLDALDGPTFDEVTETPRRPDAFPGGRATPKNLVGVKTKGLFNPWRTTRTTKVVRLKTAHSRDAFVGESTSDNSKLLLPVGPSKKQSAEILDELEMPAKRHRFVGDNLHSCAKPGCGKPVRHTVHRMSPIGGGAGKGATQPIPPRPRQATGQGFRHAGPGHFNVPTGHVAGNPERHAKAAYATNQANYETVETPLHAALRSHFQDQRASTLNRLMGKRGKTMLKRAAQNQNQPYQTAPTTPTPGQVARIAGTAVTSAALAAGGVTAASLSAALGVAQTAVAVAMGFTGVAALGAALAAGTVTMAMIQAAYPDIEVGNDEVGDILSAPSVEDEMAEPEVTETPSMSPGQIFDPPFWADKLNQVLSPHLTTAGVLGTNAVKEQVKAPNAPSDTHSEVPAVLAVRSRAIARAVTGTTARKLSGALQAGVANGEGVTQIADRVNAVFDQADRVRARQIAQTAVIGAYNEAQSTYAKSLPEGTVGTKRWLAHHDNRTRLTHRMADGQEQPLDQPYIVGGAGPDGNVGGWPMQFPGDPSAPIGLWINCRCSQAFLPPHMSYGAVASAAQAYVDALHLQTPPKPLSPYKIPA